MGLIEQDSVTQVKNLQLKISDVIFKKSGLKRSIDFYNIGMVANKKHAQELRRLEDLLPDVCPYCGK